MRIPFAVCAALAALVLAGPASAAPETPAVVVSASGGTPGTVITEADVAHWVAVADKSTPGQKARALQDQALELLIQNAWVTGEAAELGIVVTDAEVDAAFREQRDGLSSNRADYERFLREIGFSEADVRVRIRLDLLSSRLRDRITAGSAATVTDAAVNARMRRDGRVRTPEFRDVRSITTRTRAAALKALAAMRAGTRRGFLSSDLLRGTGTADAAIFRARPGRLMGPVRTEGGWIVFRVVRVHRSRLVPVDQQRRDTRNELIGEAQELAVDRFMQTFRPKWRARTTCTQAFRWHVDCGS